MGYQKKKTPSLPPKPVFDKEGWADAEKYKPIEYDLVELKDKQGKKQNGWWTGYHWDYGIKKINTITHWRQTKTYVSS